MVKQVFCSGWCVYILQCSDGSLYTGCSNNLEHRIAMHSSGHGAKYTRGRLPIHLVYCREIATKSEALKQEYAIKKLTRHQKLSLIEE